MSIKRLAEQLMTYDTCHDGIVDQAADKLKRIHEVWNKYKADVNYWQELDDLINGSINVAGVHSNERKKE